MLQRSQILVIALVVSIALAGCAGWGTGSPADNATGEPNQSDDLEQEQNDTNSSEDTSDTPLGSEDSSTPDANSSDSDASSPQSDDSDEDTNVQQEHRDLTITVTDADGNPVEGVDVMATHDDSGEERTLTTDADGTVVFSVIDGDFSLSTDDATETVTVDGDTEATLETDSDSSGGGSSEGNEGEGDENGEDENSTGEPEQPENSEEPENPEEPEQPERPEQPGELEQPESNTTLTVTVVDDETGDRIGDGEELSLTLNSYGIRETATIENGVATFENLPAETDGGAPSYHVDFRTDIEGYTVSETQSDFSTEIQGGQANEHTLNLIPDPEIHDVNFSVADNATDEPIEGASIEAVGGRLPSGGEMVFGGETDSNGEYSTTAAEYERYEVTVRADGYEPISSTVPITSDTNRTFGLTPEDPEPAPSPAPNETNSMNSTNTTVI